MVKIQLGSWCEVEIGARWRYAYVRCGRRDWWLVRE